MTMLRVAAGLAGLVKKEECICKDMNVECSDEL